MHATTVFSKPLKSPFILNTAIMLTPLSMAAQSINTMHRALVAVENYAKGRAAQIGEILQEVKAQVQHGEFIPWVEKNCMVTHKRAKEYMIVAKNKKHSQVLFDQCKSIREVLALGKPPKAPKVETRAATLNDLRKVERLRALRDCPTATEGERNNARTKLAEIEKEIGKVEPDVEKAKTKVVYTDLAKEATEVVMKGVFENKRAFDLIQNALLHTYGDDEARLKRLLAILKSHNKS
jgi:hypothetical protein